MIGIIIGAALLGVIIAMMEEGEFPGWFPMIACVLAAAIPAAIVNALLPQGFFIIGLVVGGICAGVAISALCGMSLKRATIAATIYLVLQIGISLVFQFML